MPWKAKIFLASALSCARWRPCEPAPVKRRSQHLEEGRDVAVLGVVAAEGLDQVEDQVGLGVGQLDQALARAVEAQEDRVVPGLLEGLVDVLHVLVGGLALGAGPFGALLVLAPPVVVEHADPQLRHCVPAFACGPRSSGPCAGSTSARSAGA